MEDVSLAGTCVTSAATSLDVVWDDLVDRLAVHDIRYLTGGSAWDRRESTYQTPEDAPVERLITDLVHAPQARLRHALVALLFRHPEYADTAMRLALETTLAVRAELVLRASVLIAAALRRMWRFTLSIYLPDQPEIDASALAASLGVPDPELDYGRPCLHALAERLRLGQPFPFNYESAWRSTAQRVLAQLRLEAYDREPTCHGQP